MVNFICNKVTIFEVVKKVLKTDNSAFFFRETIQELFPAEYEERANQHAEEANLVNESDGFIQTKLLLQQLQIQLAQNNLAQAAQQQQNQTNHAFLAGVFIAMVIQFFAKNIFIQYVRFFNIYRI